MSNEREEVIIKKLEFFKERNIAVHIVKNNNWFHNGIIKEINNDLLILTDEKEGDMPIFFMEIVDVEKREEKISTGNGGVE